MDAETRAAFDGAARAAVMRAVGVRDGDVMRELPGATQCFVFECRDDDMASFVVRVSPDAVSGRDRVLYELDWVRFAAKSGVPAVEVYPAVPGGRASGRAALSASDASACPDEYAVTVDVGAPKTRRYTAIVMAMARGSKIKHPPVQERPDVYRAWGEMMGALHAASALYRGPAWLEGVTPEQRLGLRGTYDEWLQGHAERALQISDAAASGPDAGGGSTLGRVARHLLDSELPWLRSLAGRPESGALVGMCHSDAHAGNFFVDGPGAGGVVGLRHLTLIDFDGSCLRHFCSDLAVSLTDHMWFQRDDTERPEEALRAFLAEFRAGYERRRPWPEREWREHGERLMAMQGAMLFVFLRGTGDPKWDPITRPMERDVAADPSFLRWSSLLEFYRNRERLAHLFT